MSEKWVRISVPRHKHGLHINLLKTVKRFPSCQARQSRLGIAKGLMTLCRGSSCSRNPGTRGLGVLKSKTGKYLWEVLMRRMLLRVTKVGRKALLSLGQLASSRRDKGSTGLTHKLRLR